MQTIVRISHAAHYRRVERHRRRLTIENEIVPTYHRGDASLVLKQLSTLVARSNESQLQLINQKVQEENLPAIGAIMVEARLKMILQGLASQLPKPHPQEVLLAIPQLESQIDEILSAENKQFLESSRITSFKDFENLFWQFHVYQRQLDNAGRMANYGQQLTDSINVRSRKNLSAKENEILKTDFSKIAKSIKSTAKEVRHQLVKFRVSRFDFAARVLAESKDIKDRYQAAFVADLDSEKLTEWAKEFPDSIDANTANRIGNAAKQIRKEHATLITKSRYLISGLHWWLRGRYGAGPDGFGLLKSPLAVTNPSAQFGLFMPIETPVPTDPSQSGPQVPTFPRRHHFIWMYEYRKMGQQNSATEEVVKKEASYERKPTSRVKMSRFY